VIVGGSCQGCLVSKHYPPSGAALEGKRETMEEVGREGVISLPLHRIASETSSYL